MHLHSILALVCTVQIYNFATDLFDGDNIWLSGVLTELTGDKIRLICAKLGDDIIVKRSNLCVEKTFNRVTGPRKIKTKPKL